MNPKRLTNEAGQMAGWEVEHNGQTYWFPTRAKADTFIRLVGDGWDANQAENEINAPLITDFNPLEDELEDGMPPRS